jgi:hypothetical protein
MYEGDHNSGRQRKGGCRPRAKMRGWACAGPWEGASQGTLTLFFPTLPPRPAPHRTAPYPFSYSARYRCAPVVPPGPSPSLFPCLGSAGEGVVSKSLEYTMRVWFVVVWAPVAFFDSPRGRWLCKLVATLTFVALYSMVRIQFNMCTPVCCGWVRSSTASACPSALGRSTRC